MRALGPALLVALLAGCGSTQENEDGHPKSLGEKGGASARLELTWTELRPAVESFLEKIEQRDDSGWPDWVARSHAEHQRPRLEIGDVTNRTTTTIDAIELRNRLLNALVKQERVEIAGDQERKADDEFGDVNADRDYGDGEDDDEFGDDGPPPANLILEGELTKKDGSHHLELRLGHVDGGRLLVVSRTALN